MTTLRRTSVWYDPSVLKELQKLYGNRSPSEIIRLALAYTLEKKPALVHVEPRLE